MTVVAAEKVYNLKVRNENDEIRYFFFIKPDLRNHPYILSLSFGIWFILSFILLILSTLPSVSQDTIRYTGKTLSNIDYHHGQLSPAVGVHNIQVMHANREYPAEGDGFGWTYNHAPMLAYWNHSFYLEYLSNPVGEHIPPGQTLLVTSGDGYNWSKPQVIFPSYQIPDGTTKEGVEGMAKDLKAVMHQRMGFYVSRKNRLLALAYYGISFGPGDSPNDGKGIGRVVCEIYPDGTFGPIYFIRYNAAWNEKNTSYPYYLSAKDKGFREACDELLANPLMMQQWVEEADRDDPLIPLKKDLKAFSYYHLPDCRAVGLWKHALTSMSRDEGKTWIYDPIRAPGFVNANAKIWGQRTSDGRYATVYNPSEFRWPLAISVSEDGLDYHDLLLVNGEISTMRYSGNYKSYGPQYVRGISEGNGTPPDGNLWVTYSMNKEDIWVACIPVPVRDRVAEQVHEVFDEMPEGEELRFWNIFCPLNAPVKIERITDGIRCLTLRDRDRYDYAKAERLFPASKKLTVEFSMIPAQNHKGILHVELQDRKGTAAVRLVFDSLGVCKTKAGYRYSGVMQYKAGERYDFRIKFDTDKRMYTVNVNGRDMKTGLFFAPVKMIDKIVFRTGEVRRYPDADTPTDQDFDVPDGGKPDEEAAFYILSLKTMDEIIRSKSASVLNPDDFKHHVDYFNRMEDENVVQAVSNDNAWTWMKSNIPLFECPQDNFEEIYYYRWWTLRKHIKETPQGYTMTEFLVQRSYADRYNMISCALGHHIYESRWLHDTRFLDDYIHLWYRGSEGSPLNKLHSFSSWTADALLNRFLVDRDTAFLLDMLPDLVKDYQAWESERRHPDGLFWQYDVKDGMEESISGGRKAENKRPTINSYMYGNVIALAEIASLAEDRKLAETCRLKADTLKELIQVKLWNSESLFFETLKPDHTFARVREAIGYIPWYFNLPDSGYETAWEQVTDKDGFLAPFGLTTAEQRHPDFRTHGCCNCEWDGAVWPFATSQTMTSIANLLNNYKQSVADDSLYFRLLELYVESQYYRGRPYIGEYSDEKTGYWLKGDQERSRYYNHSTFCDLIITGLVGLRPRADDIIEVNPLIPEEEWDWFCLDNVLYHGEIITIFWDKYGTRYHRGKGLHLLINGKEVAASERAEKIMYIQ